MMFERTVNVSLDIGRSIYPWPFPQNPKRNNFICFTILSVSLLQFNFCLDRIGTKQLDRKHIWEDGCKIEVFVGRLKYEGVLY